MSRDPSIVVIGATGFTGGLIAQELADPERGPAGTFIAAGRDQERLELLAGELDGAAVPQVVDVTSSESLHRLIRPGDAVINCAGPFAELGEPVVRACVEIGAHYLDTTGEQPFMRAMHERYHQDAREAGVSVVNGMAFEYALGDCAAAAATADLPTPLRSVDVTYAWGGTASSVGTRRTALGMLGRKGWVLEDGHWRQRPQADRRRTVTLASGTTLHAVGFGAGEVVTVPRYRSVRTVRGWLVMGRMAARVASVASPLLPVVVPVLRPLLEPLVTRAPDPSPAERQDSRFTIRVEIEAADGGRRAAEVEGRDPYGITAAITVAGASRALEPDAERGVVAPAQLMEPKMFLESLAPRALRFQV